MELKELIERVRAATGPDRGLDATIATTIDGYVFEKREKDRKAWFYPLDGRSGRKDLHGAYGVLPRYTASIDAALALVERCLPGCASERTSWRSHYRCTLIETGEDGWHNGGRHFRIDADSEASEPLAIILALLTALDQKEENK